MNQQCHYLSALQSCASLANFVVGQELQMMSKRLYKVGLKGHKVVSLFYLHQNTSRPIESCANQ
jgi:hypothetical protein